MPKLIPMLYQPDMVKAILEDRKTKTRRLKGLEEINETPGDWQFEWMDFALKQPWCFTKRSTVNEKSLADRSFYQARLKCPYGQVGDILWVRESCWIHRDYKKGVNDSELKEGVNLFFKASEPDGFGQKGFIKQYYKPRPSIHMPYMACRLFLRVKRVRVERLQDISERDAIKEGIVQALPCANGPAFFSQPSNPTVWLTATKAFSILWEYINGAGSWRANPWVWVIEFEKTTKEEAKKLIDTYKNIKR